MCLCASTGISFCESLGEAFMNASVKSFIHEFLISLAAQALYIAYAMLSVGILILLRSLSKASFLLAYANAKQIGSLIGSLLNLLRGG